MRLPQEQAYSVLQNEPQLDMSGRSPQYPFMAIVQPSPDMIQNIASGHERDVID